MVCELQYRFMITAMTFESKVNVKYTLQSVYGLLSKLLFHFFYQCCLFLAQILLMVCKLQIKFQITAMTLGSKVN